MRMSTKSSIAVGILFIAGAAFGQTVTPELRAKVEAKAAQLKSLSTDPIVISAVKAHNANPPAEDKAMTNEKWTKLTILDPYVRGFSKNSLGAYLKSRKDDQIAELFVSSADGTKVAFLAKTSSWSHAGKDKHQVPMTGKLYVGAPAMDDSTGQQLVQIGLPVLDGGKPIGSIVVGLATSKLQ